VELLFGTNVREYGQHVGRLAGFELDPTSHQVRKVIFSSDGELGNHATMRPFESVLVEPGDIEIRPYTPGDQTRQAGAVLLGHAARIFRNGRDIGRLSGLDIEIASGNLEGVIGRRSWWTKRFRVSASGLDLSVPGEVRAPATQPRAA
jgi:hypothetical protein